MGDFYSGLGCGLFVCGAVRLLRVYRLSRDPEKAADYDASLKDERTAYVANKARSMAFFICIYVQLAASMLAASTRQLLSESAKVFCSSMNSSKSASLSGLVLPILRPGSSW